MDSFLRYFHDDGPGFSERRFYVPPEISEKLMRPEEAETRLAAGQSAVDISVDKWTRIREFLRYLESMSFPDVYYHQLEGLIGFRTCALCLDSVARVIRERGQVSHQSEKCELCALAPIDRCPDRGSVYLGIEGVLHESRDSSRTGRTIASVAADYQRLCQLVEGMVANLQACSVRS
ncbi:MAG: hypothetical protein K1X75_10535 [Leptospirales bacterium]|nr:hypothetical protein [Leptospirales bacterium]